MVFRCIVCAILFNGYFGQFVMTFVDIGEIGSMSIPKMSLDGNYGKYGQTSLIFCMMLHVGVVLCMPDQYQVFPTPAVIITARLRGMLATRHCRNSTGISAHVSSRAWQRSPRFLNMFYGVAVW